MTGSSWDAFLNKASLQMIEATLVLPAVIFVYLWGLGSGPHFVSLEKQFRRFARHKVFSVVGVGLTVIFVRLILLPILKVPLPATHDEFSYLLASDTFFHWRLTNPPHPMWVHFETYHVLQHPTYMSMYMPGQGFVLALGQWLGNPWIGVLLTTASMCSAICWMLQAWVPAEWALFGGLLAVFRLGVLSYWANTYWGGSLAAVAGAVVLGALPRIKRHCRVRDAVLMATSIVALANSRPFEGLVFSLTVAAALLPWLVRKLQTQGRLTFRRLVAPVILILSLGATLTCYYCYRVTGSPFQLPQLLNRTTYSRAQYFVWQKPRPEPVYDHAIMRKFYDIEFQYFQQGRTFDGFLRHLWQKLELLWLFFLGPALMIPLLAFPHVVRDRRMRFPLIAGVVLLCALMVEIWTAPHYFAPAVGVLYMILVQCFRHLRLWQWKGRALGAGLVRIVPLLCFAMILLRVGALLAGLRIENPWPRGNLARAQIERTLEHCDGLQLVLVRYSETHSPLEEWVYNLAEVDQQKVIWARDMGANNNRELLDYYSGRKVWLVEPDQSPVKLSALRN
jgi:hypothetical protein